MRKLAAFVLLAALAGATGCGNYSNEDLEYMSVVPVRDELASNLPQASAVTIANAAELYVTTHNVSETLNGVLDKLLSLIETVRHFSPTSRTAHSRTWGPFPAREHPGWLTEMVVSRDDTDPDGFNYWLGFVPMLDRQAKPLHLIDGTFQIGGTLRQGHGTVKITTAPSRAAGIDVNMGFLDELKIVYDIAGPTVSVTMDIANLPNPDKPSDALAANYHYDVVADGRGAMTFDFWADAVPGPTGIEHLRITSRWLADGAGRGDAEIVTGDGAGAKHVECWDSAFQSRYNSKPWMPEDNRGALSDCPEIPLL